MKYTVKTLKNKGFSQRAISRELGISRKSVRNYLAELESSLGIITPKISRAKILDKYLEDIQNWFSQGLTGILIQEKLLKDKQIQVGYATVSRFLQPFKIPEVYIPLIASPAQEAQVDFGYLGLFFKNEKKVKVWCFSMVLSHSRYSYHCLVTNQSVSSFIQCHIESFEYFGGVPHTVKIDNLKAGVITPNFYEPAIQRQYGEFLNYYQSAPITARIRRGQDKGKVEAGVKYVKNNFLKQIEHTDYYQLEKDILRWTTHTANQRLHGTIKKIPSELFFSFEKKSLTQLPNTRFEILKIEHRKVNNYGHISYKNNFYSVPYQYIEKTLIIKISPVLLKVYDDTQEIAIHTICEKDGEFITREEHKAPEKQKKSEEEYIQKSIAFGTETHVFLQKIKQQKPYQWQRIMQGIFNIQHNYSTEIVNSACKRALAYNALSYMSVLNICKKNLYSKTVESLAVEKSNGFAHQLKKYDQLKTN